MSKRIMHIDIDAFFASVEIARNPKYIKEPVVVCSKQNGGIVSTANYIARQHGIKSAMKYSEAVKLCNSIICFKSDIDYYRKISNEFFNYIYSYLKADIEIISIDECYVDVTENLKIFDDNEFLFVSDLKYQIKNKFNFNVTVGIAKNKYCAKLLSDNAKPNGFLSDISCDMQSLEIDNLLFINNNNIKVLKEKGIIKMKDFFNNNNYHVIYPIIKQNYERIKYLFNLNNEKIITNLNKPNSISLSYHFIGLESNPDIIFNVLTILLKDLLDNAKHTYKTISIYYKSNKITSRISKKIDYSISILKNLIILFDNKWKNFNVELVGITLSDIISKQYTLF